MGLAFGPAKHDPPLVVDPDTVSPVPAAAKYLESVPGGRSKIEQRLGCIKRVEFPQRRRQDIRGERPNPPRAAPVVKICCRLLAKREDH